MKSRIAVFEGYASPRGFGRPMGRSSMGRPMGRPLGRPFGMNAGLGSALGRRAYYVPPAPGYGPVSPSGRRPKPLRKGYPVKRMRDTPGMKRAQNRMKKAAKICSRRRKGSYKACMRKQLKKSKR